MSNINLTLTPDINPSIQEIRMGGTVILENEKVYEVTSVEEEKDGLRIEMTETDKSSVLFVRFGDKVISYGEMYTVKKVGVHTYGNGKSASLRLEKPQEVCEYR